MRRPRACRAAAAITLLALLPALAVLPCLRAQTPSASRRTIAPGGSTSATAVGQVVGTSGCSARGCHGGVGAAGSGSRILRNEFTTWMARDRHARSFTVLANPTSLEIARKLGAASGQMIPPQQDARCLVCHAVPQAVVADAPTSPLLRDGVGCEGCHGPAGGWLVAHTTKAWDGIDADQKRALGMNPLHTPAERAQGCVGCHVGAATDDPSRPARDVNHDLIAAGHPRMAFELTAYLDDMPRHWNERPEPSPRGTAEAWAAGRLEVARAAVALLKDRASHANRPWPELAESDCFACHHDLASPSWRAAGGYVGRTPGAPEWNPWASALLPELLADDASALAALLDLEKTMARPAPSREAAIHAADELAARLAPGASRIVAEGLDPQKAAALLGQIVADRTPDDPPSWSLDVQRYLAATALAPAAGAADPAATRFIEEMARSLPFEDGYHSPRGYVPTRPGGR